MPVAYISTQWYPANSVSESVFKTGSGNLWVRPPHLLLPDQGVDIEGQEESVEQVVGEHVVEELAVDDEDVIQVVQVVQVLGDQVTQLPPILVPATIWTVQQRITLSHIILS